MKFISLLFLSLVFVLSGCASFQESSVGKFLQENPIMERIAINKGVGYIIEKGQPTIDLKIDRANEIARISAFIIDSTEDTEMPLKLVYNNIKAQINWERMTPMDQILYADLLDQVALSVKSYIDSKKLDGEKMIPLRDALQLTLDSALSYKSYLSK